MGFTVVVGEVFLGPNRFHTHSSGPDDAALQAALEKCHALMQTRGVSVMALAVQAKDNLEGGVQRVFGDGVVRMLDRDNKSELKGITTHLLTEKIHVRKLEGPVVAAFVDAHKLDSIVSSLGVTDIVYVPSTSEDLNAYLASNPSSEEIHRGAALGASDAQS
jgi:hypothetical protein